MKIVNCCGYGNTGCTAQTDFLGDHEGVVGALAPFHELGVLKCFYSIGGLFISKAAKNPNLPTREELKRSLLGIEPAGAITLTEGSRMHLELRALMERHYEKTIYAEIIEQVLAELPDDLAACSYDDLIPHARSAISLYVELLYQHRKADEIRAMGIKPDQLILGFKNDPPGAYPLFASFYSQGMTSAILRDPRDTTYDFNRHYKLGHTMERVKQHCAHYNAQLNSARHQIKKYMDMIQPHYFVHDFENFVQSESFRERYKMRMIGGRKRLTHRFDAKKSEVNIGHYKNMPKEFIQYIEDNCMENYLTYREFLIEREMLAL